VTIGTPVSVTAIFNTPGAAPLATLTVSKSGSGAGTVTSAPAGISCGPTCLNVSGRFPVGTPVTLTAAPPVGTFFTGWTGGGCGGLGTCSLVLSADTTVTAAFEIPGTIRITAGSFGSSPSSPPPSPALTGVQITGPQAFGPFTIPVPTTQTITGVLPGTYTASGGSLYFVTCPAQGFTVQGGLTTTLTYNQLPKSGSTLFPCTIAVTGPS
jgi:hypothetical protein